MKLPSKVRAIVFDVDGTLYDQRRLHVFMLRALFSEFLRNPIKGRRSVRFLRAYRKAQEGLRAESEALDLSSRQLAIACRNTGLETLEASQILERLFHAAPLAHLHRFVRSGILEFLLESRRRGVRLGVFSDYPAEAKLRAMSLIDHFDAIVSAADRDVGRLKPHPAGLERCLARLQVNPENAVYVGDRIGIDAECARRAGVCPIIVESHTTSDSCVMVNGFEDLRAMLF